MSYIGQKPSETPGTYNRQSWLAAEGQTVFTFTYQPGFLDVWLNGSKLVPVTDFTATDGTSFTLLTSAVLNDEVQAVSFGSYFVPGAYTQAQSDARYMSISAQTGLQTQQTLVDATTVTWDAANGTYGKLTLTASRTLAAPTNLVTGRLYGLEVIQGGSGSNTITWNALFKFPGGTPPVLTTAIGARDKVWFYYNGTTLDFNGVYANLA